MKYDLLLHVIHISGCWMIWQGSDGVSRADKAMGVMQGRIMEEFIPLHLSALTRLEGLKGWLDSVMAGLKPTFLEPEGWFGTGHGLGDFV
jgi:hypothetical protein